MENQDTPEIKKGEIGEMIGQLTVLFCEEIYPELGPRTKKVAATIGAAAVGLTLLGLLANLKKN